jgi:hypothetical protein
MTVKDANYQSGNAPESGMRLNALREECYQAVRRAFENQAPVLIDALPGLGKSYSSVKWAYETGKPLTVLAPRHDLLDEYEDWCEEFRLTYVRLPSFHRDCPTVVPRTERSGADRGQLNLSKRVLKEYGTGIGGKEIHRQARLLFGQKLPCQQDGECPYIVKSQDVGEADVYLATYRHGLNSKFLEDRCVVIDEFPMDSLILKLDSKTVSTAVSTAVGENPDLPFETVSDIIEERGSDEWDEKARDVLEVIPYPDRDSSYVLDKSGNSGGQGTTRIRGGHAEAPALIHGLIQAKKISSKWERAELGDNRIFLRSRQDGSVLITQRPVMEAALSVVCLDGTAVPELWNAVLGTTPDHQRVLSVPDRRRYLNEVLNLRIIRTSEEMKPYSGQLRKPVDSDIALIQEIGLQEGIPPCLITTKSALRQYGRKNLDDLVTKSDHFGALRGTNTFTGQRLGVIIGSPHPGDGTIEKWGAIIGKAVARDPDSGKGVDLDYGELGNKIIQLFREFEVLQAIMRFGRDGAGATVYVHTAALPEWVLPEERIAHISPVTTTLDGRRQVLDAIHGLETFTTIDIRPEVSISDNQVRRVLKELETEGHVTCDRTRRPHGWTNFSSGRANEYGRVKFSLPQ